MALILDNKPTPPPKPELADVILRIKQLNTKLYQDMKNTHGSAFRAVWNNPHYSGKEIIEAFGSDGVALFQLSSGIQQLLKAADPNYQPMTPPSTYTIEPQADGTIKIEEVVNG